VSNYYSITRIDLNVVIETSTLLFALYKLSGKFNDPIISNKTHEKTLDK